MAIRDYTENGKKFYEVYVNGFNSRGVRVQRRKKGLNTRRKAENAEFELKRELAILKEGAFSYTWSEWLQECVRRMKLVLRPSTAMEYEKQLGKWVNPLWGDIELSKISKQNVYDIIFTEIDDSLTPWTKKNILKRIRRIFEMAVEEGLLAKNPCNGIRVNAPEVDQKVLTSTEVDIFLKEAKIALHKFYPVWVVALMTGMRSGEMFALRWSDVDFNGKTISVSKQWTSKNGFCPTKNRRSRIVPISDGLLKFLKERKIKYSSESEFVLPHLNEWQRGEQSRVTKDFCLGLGITSIKFHDLRATFITNLLVSGVSLARVMAIVGHSQIKTTNCYLRKAGIEVKGATDSLGYDLPADIEEAKILSLIKK